jgi:hypothetical protein
VDEPATAQAKEETAHSLTAIEVGALTTLKTFASSPWKGTKMMVVHLARTHLIRELLGMSGYEQMSEQILECMLAGQEQIMAKMKA